MYGDDFVDDNDDSDDDALRKTSQKCECVSFVCFVTIM